MKPKEGRKRVVIEEVEPQIDCGRYPAKRVVGDEVVVTAAVFGDGHDHVAGQLLFRHAKERKWRSRPLTALTNDLWTANFTVDRPGEWQYSIQAWVDHFDTWRSDLKKRIAAQPDPAHPEYGLSTQNIPLALRSGALLLEDTLTRANREDAKLLQQVVLSLRWLADQDSEVYEYPLADEIVDLAARYPDLKYATRFDRDLTIWVDRERARFSSWYELFPRSTSPDPDRHGTLRDVEALLPAISAMGFNVLYLPPIHPIGSAFRKGPNNNVVAAEGDHGSPWAIGSPEGGHKAVHPQLGTIEDLNHLAVAAREHEMELALDIAFQCSPDHPWVKQHPEWFLHRPDGTIQYAENPPKKYQDIYPLNFDNDPEGIYAEILRVVRHWTAHGVRLFRVDNPHTKPVQFWERLIAEIREDEPDVLFLAEAFTRAPMMHTLGRVGFTQSYTYFTWRTAKWELEEYGRELVDAAWHMRPNFFVNTPDILHAYLQYGGPPAFKIRAVLASMLSPAWGVYAGYEKYEHVAVRPGSEEYLDSEKYQYRPRDWSDAPLAGYLGLLNDVRRRHPALQSLRALRFHHADQEQLLVFSKRVVPAGATHTGRPLADTEQADTVLVVVNLDPHAVREATLWLDLPQLGMAWDETFDVVDEVTGAEYAWGQSNYVRLDPFVEPAHIFSVRHRKAGP